MGKQSGGTFYVRMNVANTDLGLIKWLSQTFDTSTVVHERQDERHKRGYTAAFDYDKMRDVLPKVIPYLKVKQTQATLALMVLKMKQTSEGRRELKEIGDRLVGHFAYLNKRGT